MRLKYFQKLCEQKQLQRLLEKAACIGERRTDEAQVLLFQLNFFYVEVFFYHETDEVITLRSFEHTEELSPYLEVIDRSEQFWKDALYIKR